jgi:hypothetical protein
MYEAATIAINARRFRYLASWPELLYSEGDNDFVDFIPVEDRVEHLMEEVHPFDQLLLGGATELDRICAHGVAMLQPDELPRTAFAKTGEEDGGNPARVGAVLDQLSVLPREYILGVYYALIPPQREAIKQHPVFAHHLENQPDGIEEQMWRLRHMIAEVLVPIPEEAEDEFEEFSEQYTRRLLGMPDYLDEDGDRIFGKVASVIDEVFLAKE